jgi:hypothetical protein
VSLRSASISLRINAQTESDAQLLGVTLLARSCIGAVQ